MSQDRDEKQLAHYFDRWLASIALRYGPIHGDAWSKSPEPWSPDPDDWPRLFDAEQVLHIIVRRDVIEDMMNGEYDLEPMRKEARGRMKGGNQNRRDDRFGIPEDDPFWHWWHRHGKKENGNQDIQSKEEAGRHYEDYRGMTMRLFRLSEIYHADRGQPPDTWLFRCLLEWCPVIT